MTSENLLIVKNTACPECKALTGDRCRSQYNGKMFIWDEAVHKARRIAAEKAEATQ